MDFDIQNHMRVRAIESPDHVRVGQFVLRYNPGWNNPFVNYAIPDNGTRPSAVDIDVLVAEFHERQRVPRLEYLPSCAPEVESALLTVGFTVENRAPVMACNAESLVQPKPVEGVTISEPVDAADYLATATVQHAAYGEPGDPGLGQVEGLRRTAACGGVVALARSEDGEPVAAGVCSPPADGLSELTGLAVAEGSRRRGIGAMVAAHLTAIALGRSCQVIWLEPGDLDVERIYARIGYSTVGEKLNISLR